MAYDYPTSTDLQGYLAWTNTTTSGMLGIMILAVFFIIFYGTASVRYRWDKSLLFASFLSTIFGVGFLIVGLVNIVVVEVIAVIFIMALLYNLSQGE